MLAWSLWSIVVLIKLKAAGLHYSFFFILLVMSGFLASLGRWLYFRSRPLRSLELSECLRSRFLSFLLSLFFLRSDDRDLRGLSLPEAAFLFFSRSRLSRSSFLSTTFLRSREVERLRSLEFERPAFFAFLSLASDPSLRLLLAESLRFFDRDLERSRFFLELLVLESDLWNEPKLPHLCVCETGSWFCWFCAFCRRCQTSFCGGPLRSVAGCCRKERADSRSLFRSRLH